MRSMHKSVFALIAGGAAALGTYSVSAHDHEAMAESAIDPATVAAGSYTADPGHSIVGWSISHLGINDYFGMFGDVSGTLELDPADIGSAEVDVTIPVASVTVPSEGLKDHFLRPGTDGAEADFFGPDPVAARFVSTGVHSTGDTTAHIMGDLTLNGRTHPVTIDAELVGMGVNPMTQKSTLGFHGTTTIKRSEFGISKFIEIGIPDEVPLKISIAFEKD